MKFKRIDPPKQRYVDSKPSLYRAAVTNNRAEWDECQREIDFITKMANKRESNK